jgi:hypothetical protein
MKSTSMILNSLLENSDFPNASRKTITLSEYYALRDYIDTSPVEYQRPYDPSRENSDEKGLVKYVLDLFFYRDVKANMLPALVMRQLHTNQIEQRVASGRKNCKILEMTDGQHRTVIMFKLLSGEIKIPSDYTVMFNGRSVLIGDKTIPDLMQLGQNYRELIESRVFSMDVYLDYYYNIADERAAEIFAERNSGAPQSRQSVRNCQTHKLCVTIRSLARDIPDFDTKCHPLMAVVQNANGELIGKFYPGKMTSDLNFDEDVARTLATIIGYDKLASEDSMNIDQNTLDRMYTLYGNQLNQKYYEMLIDVLDFQYEFLKNIHENLRRDRIDKSFWNAIRYISVILVHRAHTSNKSLSFGVDKRAATFLMWRTLNKFITQMCSVPKKDRDVIKQTLFERSLNKMNWYSKTSGTGLAVVFAALDRFLKKNNTKSLGVILKDNRETFNPKLRAILYTEQNGKDAITGRMIDYEDAVTDHKLCRARGGETKEHNAQVVASCTNSMKSVN